MANFALLAKIGVDTKSLSKGLDSAESKVNKFKSSALGAFTKVAGGLAAIGLGKQIISLSMSAEETASKFDEVLGPSADRINEKIGELKNTIPATREELQNSIATITSIAKAFGMSDEAAANFSLGMTKVSADLASFHNMNPDEVFDKMAAAITGEFEPLKRLGIVINEARLKQEALNLGIGNGKDALNAQQKAITVQNIVLKDMGAALGNAALTSESAANQTKFLKAKVTELGTELGDNLRPIVIKVLAALNVLTEFIRDNADTVVNVTKKLVAYIAALKIVTVILPAFSKALVAFKAASVGASMGTAALTVSLSLLKRAVQSLLAATGIGLLVVVLGELGVAAVNAATKTKGAADTITDSMSDVGEDMSNTIALIEASTKASLDSASANVGLSSSLDDVAGSAKDTAEAYKELEDQIEAYFRKAKEAIDQQREAFLRAKELESIELRAEGKKEQADALDEQIRLTREAIELSDKYGITLAKAAELVKSLKKEEEKESSGKKKIEDLEEKIKAMKLEALRAQADGDKKAQEAIERRAKFAEKIVALMKEYNLTQEQATKLANQTAEGSDFTGMSEEEKRSSLTGEALKKASNVAGKDKDIRFERMADGTFQQFINGRKGDVFTEAQLQAGLQNQIDKDPTEKLLEKINQTLEGKFVSQ